MNQLANSKKEQFTCRLLSLKSNVTDAQWGTLLIKHKGSRIWLTDRRRMTSNQIKLDLGFSVSKGERVIVELWSNEFLLSSYFLGEFVYIAAGAGGPVHLGIRQNEIGLNDFSLELQLY